LEKNTWPGYRYEGRPVVYKVKSKTARGIENDNNKWVYKKPENTMARPRNAA